MSRQDDSSIEDENEAAAGDYDIRLLSKTLKLQQQEIQLREHRLKEYQSTKSKLEHKKNKILKK